MTNESIKKVISSFSLTPHPEGGFYKQVYESNQFIETPTKLKRRAMTSIYYLLAANDFSAFHRLDADEGWHYYQGTATLVLHIIDSAGQYQKISLGPNAHRFQFVIPAHCWFAAELAKKETNDYALLGCTVAPGFEFAYFEMAKRNMLCQQFPEYLDLISVLTRE